MKQHYNHIVIEFKNTDNGNIFDLNFTPRLDQQITHRWLELVDLATQLYPIDQPDRFYDFDSQDVEVERALYQIQRDIDIINNHSHLIDRTIESIHDQDTLNYLHNIFEVYHGLLDTQEATEYWTNAPLHVREALADLNIDVHRCEHVQRRTTAHPRFVTTWYGLPKTHHYFDVDYDLFTNKYQFGTIYLTYCEIGKTLEDLCKDKELDEHAYASAEAFKPYDLFSADLHVKFFQRNSTDIINEETDTWKYFEKHSEFFESRGYSLYDKRLTVGMLPVADLNTKLSNTEVLNLLKDHQFVNKVAVVK